MDIWGRVSEDIKNELRDKIEEQVFDSMMSVWSNIMLQVESQI
jgi:hypothetical protein